MRPRQALALFVILALAIPGGAATQAEESDPREAGIQVLLDERSLAVGAKDLAAFVRTVDPGVPGFASSQRVWFERLITLPIEAYSLTLDMEEAPEFTRQRDRDELGAPATVALVEERFKITGFDEYPEVTSLYLTFSQKGDRWVISSDSGLEDLGVFSTRRPWDFGPVAVLTSEHFALFAHPKHASSSQVLLSRAEAALPGVDRVWKAPWTKRVVIFVPESQKELERILDATFDVSNFVAVARSSIDIDEGWHPVTRIVINPANFLKRTAAAQVAILTHELVHVATRGASGPFVGSLVEEGIAQIAEYERPELVFPVSAGLLRANFDGTLPEDVDFLTGGGAHIRRSYLEAVSAMAFVMQRHGVQKMTEFYNALGAARIEPGTARYHFDRTLRASLGIGFSDFQSEWAAAVRK